MGEFGAEGGEKAGRQCLYYKQLGVCHALCIQTEVLCNWAPGIGFSEI